MCQTHAVARIQKKNCPKMLVGTKMLTAVAQDLQTVGQISMLQQPLSTSPL
jgi:hypothetical protein